MLSPQWADGYRRRAIAYEQQGNLVQAEADYQEAARLESLQDN
jgi:Flp pilus assembly protein TadD